MSKCSIIVCHHLNKNVVSNSVIMKFTEHMHYLKDSFEQEQIKKGENTILKSHKDECNF